MKNKTIQKYKKSKKDSKNNKNKIVSYNFLVFNVGSSSIKIKAFNVKSKKDVFLLFEKSYSNLKKSVDYDKSLKDFVNNVDFNFDFLVHRVVHGFDFEKTSFFNKKIKDKIVKGSKIAPLHNVPQLKVLNFFEKYKKKFNKNFKQIVVFDSFVYDFSDYEKILPLNKKVSFKHKIFRKGFHGLNHFFMYDYFFKNKKVNKNSKVVTVHLGSGSSVSAVKNYKFVYNSMSFSPTDGVFMSTRTGSLDPFIPLYLLNFYSKSKVDSIINFESGLLGFTGEKDFYTVFKNKSKNKNYSFAYNYFINSVVKNIMVAISVLEGFDTIIFSGAIGCNKTVQNDIVKKLKKMFFDFKVFSVKANEEIVLLNEALKLLE